MVKLIVDRAADLPAAWLAAHPEVVIVDTPVIATLRSEKLQFDDLTPDEFMKVDAYFKRGYRITTGSPIVMDPDFEIEESVMSVAKRELDKGHAVLYLVMGSGMSSTYNHAAIGFQLMRDEHLIPEFQLQVVDTQCMSTGIALLVHELYEHFDLENLHDTEPLVEYVEQNRGYIAHFFTWTNLDYIVKSGRVSLIKGYAAKLLGLVPVGTAIYTSAKRDERKLEVVSGVNSPRNLYEFARVIEAYCRRHLTTPKARITVAYANNPEDGIQLAQILQNSLPRAEVVSGLRLGGTIQAHGGPTSLHVNFHTDCTPTFNEMVDEIDQILKIVRK